MNTLRDPIVAAAVERMYTEASEQMAQLRDLDWERLSSASARERADAFSDFYLPVTPESGRLLYALVRASRPSTVVEFGMSLGLSTIHLAAAVRDNGAGRVITSELSAAKVGAANPVTLPVPASVMFALEAIVSAPVVVKVLLVGAEPNCALPATSRTL